MSAPSKADLQLAALSCGVIGLYDVSCVVTAISGIATLGYKLSQLFLDFLVFHAAAYAFFEGKLAAVYDTAAITHLQNTLYTSRLPHELGFRPFLYPPLWLLDVLPFGLLPVGLAIAAFLVLTGGIFAVSLRALDLRWEAVLAILVAPASVWVVIAGQNSFLSAALLYGGMALLDRRPAFAGLLLGLLAYKPQIWALIPLALLAARAWRPLVALTATVALLSLATLLLFGSDSWLAFFSAARGASTGAAALEMYERVRDHMTTLYAAGKMLGLSDGPAMALQVGGAALAVCAVTWAFARYRLSSELTAILVAGMFLISPYTLNYDMLLLMPAAAMLFLHPPAQGYQPGERIIYLALWLAPTSCIYLNYAGLPITPLIILLFGATAWARLRNQRKVALPATATAG